MEGRERKGKGREWDGKTLWICSPWKNFLAMPLQPSIVEIIQCNKYNSYTTREYTDTNSCSHLKST